MTPNPRLSQPHRTWARMRSCLLRAPTKALGCGNSPPGGPWGHLQDDASEGTPCWDDGQSSNHVQALGLVVQLPEGQSPIGVPQSGLLHRSQCHDRPGRVSVLVQQLPSGQSMFVTG